MDPRSPARGLSVSPELSARWITTVREWLASDAASGLHPALAGAVRSVLDGADAVARDRHGTVSVFLGRGRRAIEIDRRGTLTSALRWDAEALVEAAVRIPDGSWIVIEPRAASGAPWGPGDRLWRSDEPRLATPTARPLTIVTAVEWTRLDAIPTVAEPARLPEGGGTAVLNLVATLALDQSRRGLVYRGPYPTEQLFTALLESFRYTPLVAAPLDAFTAGDLAWDPAPHERLFEAEGLYVTLRGRVEKVIWRRRAYYRPDWQSVARHAPRRVRDGERGVVCSLWALGTTLDDHLELDADGTFSAIVPTRSEPAFVRALPDVVVKGLVAIVAASSGPALAATIREAGDELVAEWGPVDFNLVAVHGNRIRFSHRLRQAARAHLRVTEDRPARLAIAFATLAEAAHLVGDALRARAQARLGSLSDAEQRSRLEAITGADGTALEIARAAAVVLDDLSGGGADDQPDVERDEERDRQG